MNLHYLRKKHISILIFLFYLFFIGCSNKIQNDYFVFLDSKIIDGTWPIIAKITSDKINFSGLKGNKWTPIQELDFSIPKYYDYIFNTEEGIIYVVIKNTVYTYVFVDNKWEEKPEYRFELPNTKHDDIFYDGHYLGIIKDKKISFYDFDENDQLVEDISKIFVLQNDYKNIFSTFDGISVVTNKSVLFYTYNENWVEITDKSFSLPVGSKTIIHINYVGNFICVLFDTYIQFYEYISNKWREVDVNIIPLFELISEETLKSKQNNSINDEIIFNGVWASLPYETWRSSAITGGTVAIFVFDTKTNSCQIGAKNYLPFSGINIEGEFIGRKYELRVNTRQKNISVIDDFNDSTVFRYVFTEEEGRTVLKLKDANNIITNLYKWDKSNL